MQKEKLLSINDMSARLGVSPQRVSQIIKEGLMEAEYYGPKENIPRVRESEFCRYQKAREIPTEIAV